MARAADYFFGIDLGTSSCSVSYVVDDPRLRGSKIVEVSQVAFDRGDEPSHRLPSVVAIDLDERKKKTPTVVLGWAFLGQLFSRKRSAAPLRRGRDYLTSVKSDLGTFRVYPHSRIPGVRTPVHATRAILEEVAAATRLARPELDLRKSRAVVTVPASFSAIARGHTLAAIEGAGLSQGRIDLLDEPLAALIDLLNSPDGGALLDDRPRNILVLDYGAGTCDLALIRARFDDASHTGLQAQTLAISPYLRLGGDDVDRAVLRSILPQAFSDLDEYLSLVAEERRSYEDTILPAVARPLKEKLCRKIEAFMRPHANDEEKGWRLLEERPVSVTQSLERTFKGLKPNVRFQLDSSEFAELMAPFLVPSHGGADNQENLWDDGSTNDGASLIPPILETLARGHVAPRDLDILVFHGGGSLNPVVRHLLVDRLRASARGFDNLRVTQTPDMLTSVARGAAIACFWRHSRGQEFIKPILGESLSIQTSDGEHHLLVAGGTPLPIPDDPDALTEMPGSQDSLFVPSTPVPEMLVPFAVGAAGSERLAGSIKVPVPLGTSPRSPVRIKLRVERDKILKWFFALGSGPFMEAQQLEDPWTERALSGPERELLERRRQLFDKASGGGTIAPDMLIDVANHLRLASAPAEGLEVIEEFIFLCNQFDSAPAHNIRGLCLSALEDEAEAAVAYRRAAELAPTVAVYRGNLGHTLSRLGIVDEAIASLRAAVTMAPSLAYCYEELGSLCRRQGDEAGARREYEKALGIAERTLLTYPFSGIDWRRVARCRHALGRYEEAAEAARMAARIEHEARLGGSVLQWIEGAEAAQEWQPRDE